MHEQRKRQLILDILGVGRMTYADVRAEYQGRRTGAGERPGIEFHGLVAGLITDKLIDYWSDPVESEPLSPTTVLWLRAKGRAALGAGGSEAARG